MKTIAFTGHRNRLTDPAELDRIAARHPGATWLHGGAAGFDQQVADYARQHDIPAIVFPPDYRQHKRAAPFVRNRQMVDRADILIACYDGRTDGGAAYTTRYATQRRVPVQLVAVLPMPTHDTAPQTSTVRPQTAPPQHTASPLTA